MHSLSEYRKHYSHRLDPDGYPLYWAEYKHDIQYLGRAAHAEKLRIAEVVNAGMVGGEYLKEWQETERKLSGQIEC